MIRCLVYFVYRCSIGGNRIKNFAGQQEIHTVVRELRKAFPLKNDKHRRVKQAKYKNKITLRETVDEQHSEKDSDDDFDLKEALRRNKRRRKKQMMKLPIINLDKYIHITCEHFNFVLSFPSKCMHMFF